MWSFVGSKAHQRWLWHAVDHPIDAKCTKKVSTTPVSPGSVVRNRAS